MNLKELKELCENATPGPWRVVYGEAWEIEDRKAGKEDPHYIKTLNDRAIIQTDSGCYGPGRADAELIAAARTALPELLSFVDQIRFLHNQWEDKRGESYYKNQLFSALNELQHTLAETEEPNKSD